MNKIATDAADQLRKYTTNFGTAWFLINIFFRIGLHQFVPKVYADDLKEFSVSWVIMIFHVAIFALQAERKKNQIVITTGFLAILPVRI